MIAIMIPRIRILKIVICNIRILCTRMRSKNKSLNQVELPFKTEKYYLSNNQTSSTATAPQPTAARALPQFIVVVIVHSSAAESAET